MFQMKSDPGNPWSVQNLEEFRYYCCPECSERKHSKDSFIKHALEQHPLSKECLEHFDDLFDIKQEIITDDNVHLDHEKPQLSTKSNANTYYEPKCEIEENGTLNDTLDEKDEKHLKAEEQMCDRCGKPSEFIVNKSVVYVHNVFGVTEEMTEQVCLICDKLPNKRSYSQLPDKLNENDDDIDLHEDILDEENLQKCSMCFLEFTDSDSLEQHLKTCANTKKASKKSKKPKAKAHQNSDDQDSDYQEDNLEEDDSSENIPG